MKRVRRRKWNMCGSREEKRWKRQWKEKERVGWHMNKWEIWDSQGYVSYKPQESGRQRERRVKKKGNRQHNGLPWRGGGGGYQASQSQTAEVRVSLRQHNSLYECHTNRQAAHGRPKSLILPEALMFNQSQEGIQHLQFISTDSNPVFSSFKLLKTLRFNQAYVRILKRSIFLLFVVILHVDHVIVCVSVFLLLYYAQSNQ